MTLKSSICWRVLSPWRGEPGAVGSGIAFMVLTLAGSLGATAAETGYDLWLRYRPVDDAALRATYSAVLRRVRTPDATPTGAAIRAELVRAAQGMLGTTPEFCGDGDRDMTLCIATAREASLMAELVGPTVADVGSEGFVIRRVDRAGRSRWLIAANTEIGALYGTFRFLRVLQMRQSVAALQIVEQPSIRRRLLNHWDNLDGTIERGYAGRSLWKWDDLPGKLDARYIDYARANASLGINGTVLNNVNADARILLPDNLEKVAALAAVFRPYGIRVYLSANFAAPMKPAQNAARTVKSDGIGNLGTADPFDPGVRRWWKEKVEEIYRLIPDFGGFLVKANSEGMPGPQDYGRTHADGANLLAEVLAPHGGIVMWRAFVYGSDVDPDRAKRAFIEFAPLDGKFAANVFVQPKNGPLDFQPHEPFHPLFGAMPRTKLLLELQVTQEYIGESTHLVYLAPQWKQVLDANTGAGGGDATVARVVEGKVDGHPESAMAGVANIGADENWCGHDFAAANWYAFGRLAWDPSRSAESIAREWVDQTWAVDPAASAAIVDLMMKSWPAALNYLTPLGLTFTMGSNHYDPDLARRDGQYWRSDRMGLGHDRSSRGSNYVGQYSAAVRATWDNPQSCPLDDLLFFHFVAWAQPLSTGRTLWEELGRRYGDGVGAVEHSLARWQSLEREIDASRYARVKAKLEAQLEHARRWRDVSLKYFGERSGYPLGSQGSTSTGGVKAESRER